MLIVTLSVMLAYLLRFNFHIPNSELKLSYTAFLIVFLLRLVSFLIGKTYTGVIFHTSIADAKRIFLALASGTMLIGVINFVLKHLVGYYLMPNSVVGIEFFVTIFAMTAIRIFVKILYLEIRNHHKDKKNIIIYGAGNDAIMAKKALDRDLNTNYNIVGFIDPNHTGQKLEGIAIFNENDLDRLLQINEIQTIIIAKKITTEVKQRIIELGIKHNILVSTVPPTDKWINGELSARQIREIKIDDLLERASIQLDTDLIEQQITGKTVLVTGAAGSIGSEIARQLIKFHPKKLVLLDQAETPLYELDLEFGENLHFKNYEIVIADVRNKERIQRVFEAFSPSIVYHAAAYKHVPMMEHNPSEAILTNINGTKILADCANQYGTETFVFVSTDKAVNPTNIMGASKRVAEMYVQSLNKKLHLEGKKTPHFITTRFGNVLGSNGSVIPLFKKQIAAGGPLTVTHPEMTRYFMTIPEACQLVLEAGVMGKGGEIFVFDMGASVKIIDLAKNMIRLSGLELGKDIQIVFTGLRPGEKLYEELLSNEETTKPTHHSKILIAQVRPNDFDFVLSNIEKLKLLFNEQNNIEIVKILKLMIPEYKSNNSEFQQLDK